MDDADLRHPVGRPGVRPRRDGFPGRPLVVSGAVAETVGHVLLRRDRVGPLDRSGKAAGGFDILMMIYPKAGTLHVARFTSTLMRVGRPASVTGAASPGAPTFRLGHGLVGADTPDIAFAIAPPGGGGVRPIATGAARGDG